MVCTSRGTWTTGGEHENRIRSGPSLVPDIYTRRNRFHKALFRRAYRRSPMSATHKHRENRKMTISDWLDQQEEEQGDVSEIEIPLGMLIDEEPDKTEFYQTYNPCGFFCAKNHPYAKVERYGHWYVCQGQDRKAGIHSDKMKWRLVTRDRDLALRTARERMEE